MARAPPSNSVYIGNKRAFRKIVGTSAKSGYLKIVQRGDPLGRQGVESLRRGRLKSTPEELTFECKIILKRSFALLD